MLRTKTKDAVATLTADLTAATNNSTLTLIQWIQELTFRCARGQTPESDEASRLARALERLGWKIGDFKGMVADATYFHSQRDFEASYADKSAAAIPEGCAAGNELRAAEEALKKARQRDY